MSQVSEELVEVEPVLATYVPIYILLANARGEIERVHMDPVSDQTIAEIRAGDAPYSIIFQRPDDWTILRAKWIDPVTGELKDREPFPVRLELVDGEISLLDLPVGTTLRLGAQEQSITETSAVLSARYPGTFEIQLECWPFLPETRTIEIEKGRVIDGAMHLDDLLPPVTPDLIVAERARRLAEGFVYDFADARGSHRIGMTDVDMAGWDEVTKIATARHMLGRLDPILISTETGPVEVTPKEWFEMLEAAGNFRQPIWQKSFVLQTMSPIPRDFASDHHW